MALVVYFTGLIAPGLGAADGNNRSQQVAFRDSSIGLGGSRAPVNLGLRYEAPVAGGRLAAGASWTGNGSSGLSASFGFQTRF